ncbi:PEP-CTERM sorting domain-containing protein [Marinobacter sp.]|uniref:PEP-CTERM sorting domain-containing protein n=1 Tax=Marinobacter sp. TaxID=50741 RepID=UPI00384E3B54
MKMAKMLSSFIGASVFLAGTTLVQAMPMVSINPTTSYGAVGDVVSVDILWNGDGSNYIGDWDIDLAYDDTVVSYSGSTFYFGVDSFGCFDCGDFSIAGLIDLYEVSFDTPVDLKNNQDSLGNAFKLATLEFVGIADGISQLTFGASTFGDEIGNGFIPGLANGQICIGSADCDISVPEPTTLSVLILALAGLGVRRKFKKYRPL